LPFVVRLALLVGWMALIFLFSADSDSGETSGGLLEAIVTLLTAIVGPIGPEARDGLHLLLRKAAHFTEYAILALLWAGVLPRGPRRLLWALALTTGYAVTDEIHQAFVPNRGPSPFDVLIDAAGAAVALIGLWLYQERPLDRLTKIH
jgi:VanZ family protein